MTRNELKFEHKLPKRAKIKTSTDNIHLYCPKHKQER